MGSNTDRKRFPCIYRSKGACHRNGLCEIRAHVRARVGAAVRLLGAAGQLRFVVFVAAPNGGRCFSGYVSGDGDHTDAFS